MADPLSIFLVSFAISFITSAIVLSLQPDIKLEGPQLADRRVQTATYGAFIQRVYGSIRIAGNIIWVENNQFKETAVTTESGGKGGPTTSQTNYYYSATFALALTDNEILGVSRIWADAVLIYDVRLEDVIVQYESQAVAEAISVFTGSQTQLVHPRIEANQPDAPAYRGVSYIVFEDLQLAEFGNRLPNITVEVIQADSATLGFADRMEVDNDVGFDLDKQYPIGISEGVAWTVLNDYATSTSWFPHIRQIVDISSSYHGSEPIPIMGLETLVAVLKFNAVPWVDNASYNGLGRHGYDGLGTTYITALTDLDYPAKIYWQNFDGGLNFDFMAYLGLSLSVSGIGFSEDDNYMILFIPDQTMSPNKVSAGGSIDLESWYIVQVNGINDAEIIDSGTCSGMTGLGTPEDIGITRGGDVGFGSATYRVGCLENDLKHYWTAYSGGDGEVQLFEIDASNVMSEVGPQKWRQVGSPGTGGVPNHTDTVYPWIIADKSLALIGNGTGMATFSRVEALLPQSVSLDSVVTNMCANIGLSASDIDVTSLTGQVEGVVFSTYNTMLGNIEALQLAYKFDIVESEYILKFVKRGTSSVATLGIEDLAAREKGQEAPDPLEVTRGSEVNLPRSIEVSYYDRARDYNIGQQYKRRNF